MRSSAQRIRHAQRRRHALRRGGHTCRRPRHSTSRKSVLSGNRYSRWLMTATCRGRLRSSAGELRGWPRRSPSRACDRCQTVLPTTFGIRAEPVAPELVADDGHRLGRGACRAFAEQRGPCDGVTPSSLNQLRDTNEAVTCSASVACPTPRPQLVLEEHRRQDAVLSSFDHLRDRVRHGRRPAVGRRPREARQRLRILERRRTQQADAAPSGTA